jgi:Mrp family chromosome partitioning ATPase
MAAPLPIGDDEPLAPLRKTVDVLWSTIAPAGKPKSLRRILFTAPGEDQGTTTVALCAAMGLTRHLHARVTMVEAEAPSAMLATMLGENPTPGLSEVLAGEVERARAVRRGQGPNLLLVPGGGREFEPGVLNTPEARDLFRWLGEDRDFLLIDAPPILLHPEARPLLWQADGVIVVLEAGRSRKDQSRALVRALSEAGVEVLGCVLNRYKPELPTWLGGSEHA